MRRVASIHALIPALYLKGIATGDFTEALSAILGERASGLLATNVVRLKAGWEIKLAVGDGDTMKRRPFAAMFAVIMGVTALLATVLHGAEAGAWSEGTE